MVLGDVVVISIIRNVCTDMVNTGRESVIEEECQLRFASKISAHLSASLEGVWVSTAYRVKDPRVSSARPIVSVYLYKK